jgi:hypothetical protein
MVIAKCGHAGCTCLPTPETNYCCQHCEGVQETGAPEEVGCGCGHIGCDPASLPAPAESATETITLENEQLATA